jgi:hypothetical protein
MSTKAYVYTDADSCEKAAYNAFIGFTSWADEVDNGEEMDYTLPLFPEENGEVKEERRKEKKKFLSYKDVLAGITMENVQENICTEKVEKENVEKENVQENICTEKVEKENVQENICTKKENVEIEIHLFNETSTVHVKVEHTSAKGVRDPNEMEKRWKSKLCSLFMEGKHCPHEGSCGFAHGVGELLPFLCRNYPNCNVKGCKFRHFKVDPAKMKPSVKNNERTYYKTQMCSFFKVGRCKKGEMCPYAHYTSELRAGVCFRGIKCNNPQCKWEHPSK